MLLSEDKNAFLKGIITFDTIGIDLSVAPSAYNNSSRA
jgi:hypothetical protein